MPPKRALPTEEVKKRKAEYDRQRRFNLTEEQKAQKREQNKQRKQNQRSSMNEQQRADERERNAQHKKTQRSMRDDKLAHIAVNDFLDESNILEYNCSNLNILCNFCNAKHFPGEQPQDKLFTQCCHKGKVVLEETKISYLI